MALPTDVDLLGGVGSSATNIQNLVVSQTNIRNGSCVFVNVNTHMIANQTAVAVETTIHVAEERRGADGDADNDADTAADSGADTDANHDADTAADSASDTYSDDLSPIHISELPTPRTISDTCFSV